MNAIKDWTSGRGDIRFRTRCKAWTGRGAAEERIMVSRDGTVRVYDDVAGHYTLTHALSEGQQARMRTEARKLAREARAARPKAESNGITITVAEVQAGTYGGPWARRSRD